MAEMIALNGQLFNTVNNDGYRRLMKSANHGMRCPATKGTYPHFWQSPLSDIAYQNQQYATVLVRPGDRYMEEKQTGLKKVKISNAADNAGITQ